jgi:hypothetical protein
MINKKRKPDTEIKGKSKEKTKLEIIPPEPVPEEKAPQPVLEATPAPTSTLESTPTPTPVPETKAEPPATTPPSTKPKPLTMSSLKSELDELRTLIQTLTTQMADVQSQLTLKRKPTSNGKVQIRDRQTGKIYKSKNSVYQTMLKAGELDKLVEAGTFGPNPAKNTFGVYALFRALGPDRFEEVHEQQPDQPNDG